MKRRSFTHMTDQEKAEFIRDQAEELELFAVNHGDIYEQRLAAIRTAVRRRWKGATEYQVFQHLERAYRNWFKLAVHHYAWTIDRDSDEAQWFPADSIRMAAASVAESDTWEVWQGNYDEHTRDHDAKSGPSR